jgi:signal peptidase II
MIYAVAALILSLDQFTKFLVTKNLSLNESVPVIRGLLYITLIHNRGAAFGIFKNQISLFILTATFAIIMIYFNLEKTKEGLRSLYGASLCLILAGAVGNLIDRLFLGYVVDFLDFRIWPVFNVADSAITVGAILLGWSILRNK